MDNTSHEIVLADTNSIHSHKEVDDNDIIELSLRIKSSGIWKQPILVDFSSGTVIDGHESYYAAHLLNLKRIPILYVKDNKSFSIEHPKESVKLIKNPNQNSICTFVAPTHQQSLTCHYNLDKLSEINNKHDTHGDLLTSIQKNKLIILSRFYNQFIKDAAISSSYRLDETIRPTAFKVPDPNLRKVLVSNHSIAAILPYTSLRIEIGENNHFPFYLTNSGVLQLSISDLSKTDEISFICRWGMEAANALDVAKINSGSLNSILRHAADLIIGCSKNCKEYILEHLPPYVAADLTSPKQVKFSCNTLIWQASILEGATYHQRVSDFSESELDYTLERILTHGGDSRIVVDKLSGFNSYGVPPRPRPEAVQFSSTTASAISDHGFSFCNTLRRDLLANIFIHRSQPDTSHRNLNKAITNKIKQILNISDVDVIVTASGTDAELISTMLAAAGSKNRKILNILVAPNETGRGIILAGEGKYFDNITASGMAVERGEKVWADITVETSYVDIRDKNGAPRKINDICNDFLKVGKSAFDKGYHIVAHILPSSKTGLSAPSIDTVDKLVSYCNGHIDVVVDACQVRNNMSFLGKLVSKGWMLQITGSKFLTGPPFSGALIIPTAYRERKDEIRHLVSQAPGVTRREEWTQWWFERLPLSPLQSPASFAPLLRWLPALMEAYLLNHVPRSTRIIMASRFRHMLIERIKRSPFLDLIEPSSDNIYSIDKDDLEQLSIFSFRVKGKQKNQQISLLNEQECKALFVMLNQNLSTQLVGLNDAQQLLIKKSYHVGQPVKLVTQNGEISILRFALGARFFNIVGHAEKKNFEMALDSQISDAISAIDKLEILCDNSWQLFKKL